MTSNNKSENIVPVFSGERYHGETIEGIYFPSGEQPYIELKEGGAHPVKPETLKMSLDGSKWHTMEQLKEALEFKAEYDKKCIIDPLTWGQGYHVTYKCPHCESRVLYEKDKVEHCPTCKEAVIWSEIEKEG